MGTLRILGLLTIYGGIAFAGEQAVGQLTQDPDPSVAEQGERSVERRRR